MTAQTPVYSTSEGPSTTSNIPSEEDAERPVTTVHLNNDEDQSKPEEQQRGVVYDDDEENAFTGCMMMICGTILCLALPKCVEVFGTHLTKEVPAVIDVLMQYLLLWTTMLAATLFLYASVRLIRNWLYRRSGSRMRLGWRFMAKKVKLEDEGSAGEVV